MPLARLARDILDFWFGSPPFANRSEWFRKDATYDAAIRDRFGEAIAAALAGAFGEWCTEARGSLARILLLDQFTRNAFRDTPQAFSGDTRALATAQDAVAKGFDQEVDVVERIFFYLPFQHSEDLAAQEQALSLVGALAAETGNATNLRYAERHAAIVRRFARFPHRNAILGRASTPQEIEFLQTPGSGF